MKSRIRRLTFILSVSFAICFRADATTLYVPTEEYPTIEFAMSRAKSGDTVIVRTGQYSGSFHVNPGVVLVSETLFGAVLSGGGRGTVVTLGTGSTVSGFEIRDGTIGVFSTSAHASVTRNRIIFNQQSGILCVGHLPEIADNIVGFNRGSGIQGWDVRTTSASINHNTIVHNTNHGISLGGNTDITVENNIISNNEQFGIKPSESSVKVELNNNNFFDNSKFSGILPGNNISFDPGFLDPKNMDFNLKSDSQLIGLGQKNQRLGARIVY